MESAAEVRPARDGDEKFMNELWVGIDMSHHKANVALDPKYLFVAVDKNDEPVGMYLLYICTNLRCVNTVFLFNYCLNNLYRHVSYQMG